MQQLNFPKYTFRIKSKENKYYIFGAVRKKFLMLTPEEWVRQHTVQYLINEKKYRRLQSVVNGVYEVQIIDCDTGNILKLADPFLTAISEFVDIVYFGKYLHSDNFQKTNFLQKSMIDALL